MFRSTTRRARLFTVTALASLPLAFASGPAQAVPAQFDLPSQAEGTIPGAWIVTLTEGASPDVVAAEHSRRYEARIDHLYEHAVRGYAARMSDQAAAKLAQDPRVASVERDRLVSIDAAQPLPTGIDRIDGEMSSTTPGDGAGTVDVDVAVLDTGIASHPDLTIAGGINCTAGKKGYADGNGHGTHVAGTIGAKDDAIGVVGVAPGARLWAVKVLSDQGSGTRSQIMCGIDWVTARASTIEVANMSLGGSGTDGACSADAYHNAICRSVTAGVTYVVAAGNESDDAANHVPAAYDEVITVSALADFDGKPGGAAAATCRADVDETFADFSNYGADVDLIAPGVCIRSTWKGGGYNTISGTSMAAPHVAGAAALHKASKPGATPAEVKDALVAAGTSDWSTATDRDAVHEPLLNLRTF